jgi:hypothetical protein
MRGASPLSFQSDHCSSGKAKAHKSKVCSCETTGKEFKSKSCYISMPIHITVAALAKAQSK